MKKIVSVIVTAGVLLLILGSIQNDNNTTDQNNDAQNKIIKDATLKVLSPFIAWIVLCIIAIVFFIYKKIASK